MKNMLFRASVLAMALAGFYVTDSVLRHAPHRPLTPPKSITSPVGPQTIDPAAQKRIDTLRQRVRDLESLIAMDAATASRAGAGKGAEPTGKVTRLDLVKQRARGQITQAQFLDWLWKNDPEYFVSYTNDAAVAQQRSITAKQMRIDLFSRLDESLLDAESFAAHRECLAICDELIRLAEIQKNPWLELEVLRKLSKEKNQLESRLEKLYPYERQALVRQYVRELGYGDEDSVGQTILEILNNTTGEVIRYE